MTTATAALVGMCVVTSLTPLAGVSRESSWYSDITVEGLRTAFLVLCVALCFSSLCVLAIQPGANGAVSMTFALSFACGLGVLAEYQVALLLGLGRKVPVLLGNMIVSVPVIIIMALLPVTVANYSWGLAGAFAIRSLCFGLLTLRSPPTAGWRTIRKPSVFRGRVKEVLLGGSATLALSLISVGALFLAGI